MFQSLKSLDIFVPVLKFVFFIKKELFKFIVELDFEFFNDVELYADNCICYLLCV